VLPEPNAFMRTTRVSALTVGVFAPHHYPGSPTLPLGLL